jgi:hypothetical protein
MSVKAESRTGGRVCGVSAPAYAMVNGANQFIVAVEP